MNTASRAMSGVCAPTPPATDAPKPANPEPLQAPMDPEKGHDRSGPAPGKSEHPKQ